MVLSPVAKAIAELAFPLATLFPLTVTVALALLKVGVIVIEETLLATLRV